MLTGLVWRIYAALFYVVTAEQSGSILINSTAKSRTASSYFICAWHWRFAAYSGLGRASYWSGHQSLFGFWNFHVDLPLVGMVWAEGWCDWFQPLEFLRFMLFMPITFSSGVLLIVVSSVSMKLSLFRMPNRAHDELLDNAAGAVGQVYHAGLSL